MSTSCVPAAAAASTAKKDVITSLEKGKEDAQSLTDKEALNTLVVGELAALLLRFFRALASTSVLCGCVLPSVHLRHP
jgi:hypothetical protein